MKTRGGWGEQACLLVQSTSESDKHLVRQHLQELSLTFHDAICNEKEHSIQFFSLAFPCIPSGAVTSGLVIIRIFQINSHLFPHPSLQGDFFNSSAIACSSILIVFTYKYKSQKKILTTEQEDQKYTNYSNVIIKEGLLGTRRYLSRGGGGKEERGDQGEDGGEPIEN